VGFLRRKIMIRDKDIFEIKRLALHKNCHYQRLKGCYVNSSKEILATIDENFLNLPEEQYYKYLDIAKQIFQPKAIDDKNLEIVINDNRSLRHLTESNLDDAAVAELYEAIIELFDYVGNYMILLFKDTYDIMKRTSDNRDLDESEEVYDYMICAICPVELEKPALQATEEGVTDLERKWIIGKPVDGFVYPAFEERSEPSHDLMEYVLSGAKRYTATECRIRLEKIIENTLGEASENCITKLNALLEGIAAEETEEKETPITGELLEEMLKNDISEADARSIVKTYSKAYETTGFPTAGWLYSQKSRDKYYAEKHKERGKQLLGAAATALSHVGSLDLASEIEEYLSRTR
jgi:hypothetical protein